MRFIEPVRPREATGLVAEVYGEIRKCFVRFLRDLEGNSVFVAHSPRPELLAALWGVTYETVLADGELRRADKETIAATVSRTNECPWCVDIHSVMSGSFGEGRDTGALLAGAKERIGDRQRRALVEWAAATRDPESTVLRNPPFGDEDLPEAVGTAVNIHYVNRIASVFHGQRPLGIGVTPLRRIVIPAMGRMPGWVFFPRGCAPGRSLRLLPEAELPDDLGWAASSPRVAGAFARMSAATEAGAEAVLDEAARECVAAAIEAWEGTDPPLGSEWIHDALSGLDPRSTSVSRVALLAALAPYRIDASAVDRFRRVRPRDDELVAAVAWGAFRAARRVGSWLHRADDPRPAVTSAPSSDRLA